MHPCGHFAEEVYKSPEVNNLLDKISPIDLRDDLRQEIALVILTSDCNKIGLLKATNKLTGYVLKMVCNMAFSSTSNFYYKYKKSDLKKAIEYIQSLTNQTEPNAKTVKSYLARKKQIDAINWHEVTIFEKYAELNNYRLTAEYFDIPLKHVWDVVQKLRTEIKSRCFT